MAEWTPEEAMQAALEVSHWQRELAHKPRNHSAHTLRAALEAGVEQMERLSTMLKQAVAKSAVG